MTEDGKTALPLGLLMNIQRGTMATHYRGIETYKNPFDLALYAMLQHQLRPRTVIEIGAHRGGSALWFADQLTAIGVDAHVHALDIVSVSGVVDPRITFHRGSALELGATVSDAMLATLPRPWLVIEDADHRRATTYAVMRFFDPWFHSGDWMVVEDGILTAMGVADDYGGGPHAALTQFLAERGQSYRVAREYCDFYGHNVTWNVDGWLEKLD
ncbi:MAG: CmcI family methyltransferase [Sphingopyxis sp.]